MSGKVYDEDDLKRVASIFSEQVRREITIVMEAVDTMQEQVARLPHVEEKLDELQNDMRTVKAAITDLTRQSDNHERRLHSLETHTA